MKRGIQSLLLILITSSSSVYADGLFVEAGPGIFYSEDTTVSLVRFQKDTSKLFGHESFYEAAYASWNGENSNRAVSLARGLRWGDPGRAYRSADIGICHISRTTGNLGTPFQFYFRAASGMKVGGTDLSIGFIHYSNGKLVFRWHGPNRSENFLTVSIGLTF